MTRRAATVIIALSLAAAGCSPQSLRAASATTPSRALTAAASAPTHLRVKRASYVYCTDDASAERRMRLDLEAVSASGGRLYLDAIELVRAGAPLARSQGLACEASRSGHSPQILDGRLGWTLVAGEKTPLSLVCWPQVSSSHPSAGAFSAELELSVELAGVARRVTHEVRARFDAPYTDRTGRRACQLAPQRSVQIAGN